MPNIYTEKPKEECCALNCTPSFAAYFKRGEVVLCEHDAIYFCREYVSKYDPCEEAFKSWYKLNPWLNWWKYPKAEKLLKPSVQTK